MMLWIDHPSSREISQREMNISGWCAFSPFGDRQVRLEIGGIPVSFSSVRRRDVEHAYPDCFVLGFDFRLELAYYMRTIRGHTLFLEVVLGDVTRAEARFAVSPKTLRNCMAAASGL